MSKKNHFMADKRSVNNVQSLTDQEILDDSTQFKYTIREWHARLNSLAKTTDNKTQYLPSSSLHLLNSAFFPCTMPPSTDRESGTGTPAPSTNRVDGTSERLVCVNSDNESEFSSSDEE